MIKIVRHFPLLYISTRPVYSDSTVIKESSLTRIPVFPMVSMIMASRLFSLLQAALISLLYSSFVSLRSSLPISCLCTLNRPTLQSSQPLK